MRLRSTFAVLICSSMAWACSGGGGGGNNGTADPAPTLALSASPGSVSTGKVSTLSWSTTNATSCTASGSWTGGKATSGSESTGALQKTSTYSLTCSGAGGSVMKTVDITVSASAAPTVTLSASPQTVTAGSTTALSWSSTNATGCTASGGWSGSKPTSGTATSAALDVSTDFTLTCTGAGGSASKTVTVSVGTPTPAPTVTLSANPTTVASGGASTLSWSSTNATSCTASGGWSGSKPTSGTATSAALNVSTDFTLTCTGNGGSAGKTVTVTVGASTPAPTVTLSANPTTVASGGASTLTWSSTNATSCTASGGWSGSKATSGSQSTGNLTVSTGFTLSCTGAGGSTSRSVSVAVAATPTVTLTANPLNVTSGGTSTLTWSSTNATSCTASGGWTGTKATSGTATTPALSATTTFTLTCTGSGGSTGDSVTVTVGASGPAFPLHVEAGKRYLIDANGQPFLIHGDAAWSLIVQLTRDQVDQYLEDRRLKGFNTIIVNLIEHKFATNPPYDAYGDAPFLTAGDFSTPNPAYFDQAEYVISKAAQKGMLVLLFPAYMGYNGGDQGWYQEMVANTATKLRAYGQYVANRFAAYDNIIWVQGGDYNPPDLSILRAIPNGIRDVSTKWLQTFHGSRGTSALGFLGTGEAWLTLNDIYTDETTVVSKAFTEYGRSSMPFFLIEARYENETGGTETVVRSQAYQAVLSGASGQVMGNNPIWLFGSGWQTALGSPGATTLAYLRSLMNSLSWWTLVPDTGNTFLTGGISSGASRAVAARYSSGAAGIVYTPSVRALTIDMSKLSGPNVRARWYDPTNGAYTTAPGSPFPASGPQSLTPPGNNSHGLGDWVLLLESTP